LILIKNWVDRELGAPVLAKVRTPFLLPCFTGSSLMVASSHALLIAGFGDIPNCTMKFGIARKNATVSKETVADQVVEPVGARGDNARVTSTTKSPFVVVNFTRNTGGAIARRPAGFSSGFAGGGRGSGLGPRRSPFWSGALGAALVAAEEESARTAPYPKVQ
jgi:hypothetical protein